MCVHACVVYPCILEHSLLRIPTENMCNNLSSLVELGFYLEAHTQPPEMQIPKPGGSSVSTVSA